MTEETNFNVSQPFSRREWLMLIAIMLAFEYWLLTTSYFYKNQQDVIGYVSFAATIASLLLALIAIIYGYYQSDGQQRSAAAIASQIDSMRDVQKQLNNASDGIADQLTGMTVTASELKNLTESLDGTHRTLGVIEGGINGVLAEQLAIKVAVASMQSQAEQKSPDLPTLLRPDGDPAETARRIFEYANSDLAMLGVALDELVKKNGGNAPSWTDFIDVHFAKPLRDSKKPLDYYKFTVVGLQLMQVFRSLGLVELSLKDGDPIGNQAALNVKNEFFEALALCAKKAIADAGVSRECVERIRATFQVQL